MHNRRRRKAKARRLIRRLLVQLRPQGGRMADNGQHASSLASRGRDLELLYELHDGLRANFHAPVWY